MENTWNQIWSGITSYAPTLLGALAILIIGWIVALIVSAVVRGLLRRTEIDDRIMQWLRGGKEDTKKDISKPVSKVVYWLIMLVVLVAFFQSLGLTIITEPLNQLLNQVFAYAPKILGGLALLLVALVVASLLRSLLRRLFEGINLDERFGPDEGEAGKTPLSASISNAVYWLVLLLFLPAILGAMELEGLLAPVQNLASQVLGYLPNILAGTLILLVGWFVARIVRQIVSNLLAAVGADALSERIGMAGVFGETRLSGAIGIVVFALILVPVVIGALNALELDSLTGPTSRMLDSILGALPAIFAALLIIGFSFVVGKVLSNFVAKLLEGVGFNRLPVALGLIREDAQLSRNPSQIVGTIVLVGIMLFAITEAAKTLGFGTINELLGEFLGFAGHVLLGLIILALGLFLARLAAQAVSATKVGQSGFLAGIVRTAVIVLAAAMALRQMGFANDIINLAFGLLLGAIAVAAALAFGLGGRDAAAKQLANWQGSSGSSGTDAPRPRD